MSKLSGWILGSAATMSLAVLLWTKTRHASHHQSKGDEEDEVQRGSIFTVTERNGYLPLRAPLKKLPAAYAKLEELMANLPSFLSNPDPNRLADAVRALPEYQLTKLEDAVLLQALMRDYSILVSAFLLEGKTKSGKPRSLVPRNIAVPFSVVASKVDEPMIMSYDSYCLSNCYNTTDPPNPPPGLSGGRTFAHWEQLRLIRAFDGGPEEATFILIHSEIESHTPDLIAAYDMVLDGLVGSSVPDVGMGLTRLVEVLERIVVSQLKMFNASNPANYEKWVRPWIFGWKSNPDFPNGVVFEGTPGGGAPTFLRGETGAQSTIIPSLDAFLGIAHAMDSLRHMLAELEAYRPAPHREYLTRLREAMMGKGSAGVQPGGAVSNAEGASTSTGQFHALRAFITTHHAVPLAKLFNAAVGLVWCFRDIHVSFSDVYIARYTTLETATGGTPFRAYLRKHRDESMSHQLTGFGNEAMFRPHVPTKTEQDADVAAILDPAHEQGIPSHLLKRHADIIDKWGKDEGSLKRKMFPTGSQISKWGVEHT